MTPALSRRAFLSRSALLGCSLAASPLLTPVSYAAAPWDTRLVVIILRGAMDGLDVVRPYGDPSYAALRGAIGGGPESGALDLDGYFALHPALEPLMPLWQSQQLGFFNAVSTPYRDKRSHFDGQDILEAGTDGRGYGEMKVLSGPAPKSDWSPDANLALSPQAVRLAEMVMEEDPAFHAALSEAMLLSGDGAAGLGMAGEDGAGEMMGGTAMNARAPAGGAHVKVAQFAAEQLRGDTRVISFSINGWDTHSRQDRAIRPALGRLSDTILTLQNGVGPEVWQKTAVVAMTEFGRTARVNGTGGTDHGTGGVMVMAGGALRGGRVYGDWPGLDEASLYQRRDLMPTRDVRAPAAWMMRAMAGLDRAALEQVVFPGLEIGGDPGLLL